MKIPFYLDVWGNERSPEDFMPPYAPCWVPDKPEGATRYKVIVEIPTKIDPDIEINAESATPQGDQSDG